MRNRNVAAVIVTADLPAGMDVGSRLDVTVSALGDAPSLMGGTLLLTQMSGTDGDVYASAQGAVSVTGFDVAGQAQTLSQGVPTAGRISNGAIIETSRAGAARRTAADPGIEEPRLQHRGADRRRDQRLFEAAVPAAARRSRWTAGPSNCSARRTSASTRYMAEIGELAVEPDTAARVVLDARTGTVVIGQDVQISTVAVTHGTLSVRVTETPDGLAAGAAVARHRRS